MIKKLSLLWDILIKGFTIALLKFINETNQLSLLWFIKSHGGLINESDQLYKLAHKNKLNTYTLDFCYNACTTAYIAGRERFAQRGTEFGFHQPGTTSTGGIQGGREQRLIAWQYKTIGRFNRQGVTDDFVSEIYHTEHSGLWKPLQNKLVAANIINTLVKKKEMLFLTIKTKSLYPKNWY